MNKLILCCYTSSINKDDYYYKNPPGGNFASGAVWHTIAFKVSAFQFFGQKLTDVPIWLTILSSILITIIVAE